MKDLLLAILAWARSTLSPAQVCWLCLAATCAIGYALSTQYVRAGDLDALRAYLRDLQEATFIDLNRSDVQSGLAQLESLGLIGPGRAAILPTEAFEE